MVYQLDSYRYWEVHLDRSDFVFGQFGENLTVDGLADNEVCIGDRFRIALNAERLPLTPRLSSLLDRLAAQDRELRPKRQG